MADLPSRLRNDPIIEAIVELRFTPVSNAPIADLLPGLLFSNFRDRYPKLESTSISQVPPEIRKTDRNLAHRPLKRLVGEQFSIAVGDRVVSMNCQRPYVGWKEFQPRVLEVLHFLRETGLIESIQRLSVKYVNLIPEVEVGNSLSGLKLSVHLGSYDLSVNGCTLQTNIVEDGILNIVQVVSGAEASFPEGKETIFGTILDIDSIYEHKWDDFWAEFENDLEVVRAKEKDIFFSLISDGALERFDPVWGEGV